MNALAQAADSMALGDFLGEFFRPAAGIEGDIVVAQKLPNGSFRNSFFADAATAASEAQRIDKNGRDAYFAPALFGPAANRKAENALGASCFWADLDCGPDKPFPTQGDALQALKDFCRATGLPRPTLLVSSGVGVHVYWLLDQFVPREQWLEAARKLKALCKAHGFAADPSRTADIASVLRPVGTRNFKDPDNPRQVVVVHPLAGFPKRIGLDAFVQALDAASPGSAASPTRLALPGGPGNLALPPPTETTENIAMVKSMLAAIDPDGERDEWRQIIWALQSTGWTCAEQLARDWSMAGAKWEEGAKMGERAFQNVVKSFDPRRGTNFGTLVHIAKAKGWRLPPKPQVTNGTQGALNAERLTGDSGDIRNGKVFAELFRDKLLFVHETSDVLKFDDSVGWVAAPPHEADRAAKEALVVMRAHAAECWKAAPDDNNTKRLMAHVERSSQAQRLYAMIEMAKSEPGITVSLNDFDADPMFFGVQNGVLDLRTGRRLNVAPDVLVSKRANVAFDPTAECQRWKRFLEEVQPDAGVRAFLQRFAGYCLTGMVDEQVFAFLYGLGRNGKSVFVELLAWLLSDYAHKVPTEMLMQHQRNPQGPSPDVVALKGRRFVYATETEDGARLAAARIKELTGGDTLSGRVPYGRDFVTFRPTHKLVIVGNHKPEIGDNSFGMWRRVLLTPFENTIPENQCDPQLLDKLKAEGPGILNWALAGLRRWEKVGLQVPTAISAATAAYREENDIIGEWLRDNCVIGAGQSARKDVLYVDYEAWAKANGFHPMTQKRLTRKLGERGYRLAAGKRTVLGVAVR